MEGGFQFFVCLIMTLGQVCLGHIGHQVSQEYYLFVTTNMQFLIKKIYNHTIPFFIGSIIKVILTDSCLQFLTCSFKCFIGQIDGKTTILPFLYQFNYKIKTHKSISRRNRKTTILPLLYWFNYKSKTHKQLFIVSCMQFSLFDWIYRQIINRHTTPFLLVQL